MFRLLAASADEAFLALMRKYAKLQGYLLAEAKDGAQAVLLCQQQRFDAILLDESMGIDPRSVCREIHKVQDAPVIVLAERSDRASLEPDMALCAAEAVFKPVPFQELAVRVQALAKRAHKTSAAQDCADRAVTVGGLTIDHGARAVMVDGERLDMPHREFELLWYLIKNRGIAVTRRQLMRDVWGRDYADEDRTLDVHIKQLRKRLDGYGSRIETLRGVGYRFDD